MDVGMRPDLAAAYTSRAQRARVVTEAWVEDNAYCPACDRDALIPTPRGTRVVDFVCDVCEEDFQLKSQSHPFGTKVLDSAYGPMMERVRTSRAPSFFLLHYDPQRWRVQDLLVVPGHFLAKSAIERRSPLKPTARRAGWVGCNILLGSIPPDARIAAVRSEVVVPVADVREAWRRFAFLGGANSRSRGWFADVLACVRELDRTTFALADVYSFEDRLLRLHPENRHVRPKIRQQLQMLRDRGILEFRGAGRYRVLVPTSTG